MHGALNVFPPFAVCDGYAVRGGGHGACRRAHGLSPLNLCLLSWNLKSHLIVGIWEACLEPLSDVSNTYPRKTWPGNSRKDGPISVDRKEVFELLPGEFEHFIGGPEITRQDLAFTHSIFVQCFLPMRALRAPNNQHWEVTHGSASIAIEAGCLADPKREGHWEEQEVPAGPKARLLFAYINDYAIRHNNPIIDLGKSLRAFMEKNGVPIGGPNARELTRQLKNIAAARILLGTWGDKRVSTQQTRIASRIDFWLDRNPKVSGRWQPEMQLAPEYFEALGAHRVPIYFPALVKLQANPRAMDIFSWLVYRMRSVTFPVRIPYVALHPVFGGTIKLLKHFKFEFRQAVLAAHRYYPEARVEFKKDYVILYRSRPLITRDMPNCRFRGNVNRITTST